MEPIETENASNNSQILESLQHLYSKNILMEKVSVESGSKRKRDHLITENSTPDSVDHRQEVQITPEITDRDGRSRRSYNLAWKDFPENVVSFFRELKDQEELADVTLACEGFQVPAHKLVLSASSALFRSLLKNNPCQHPIIILNDVKHSDLVPLLHYMYHGEVMIDYRDMNTFLRTARLLQVRGLDGGDAVTADLLQDTMSRRQKENDSFTDDKDYIPGLINLKQDCVDFKISPKRKRKNVNNWAYKNEESDKEKDKEDSSELNENFSYNNNNKDSKSNDSNNCSENIEDDPKRECYSPPSRGATDIPLHMQIPSLMSTLPHSVPANLSHSISSVMSTSSPFPPYVPTHYNPHRATPDDASDTCPSDRSDERQRDLDVEDEDNCLDKMSGLANMAALKGLTGFAGPSNLLNLSQGQNLIPSSEASQGRSSSRFDFYRVRATDPRPCHLCGKIYKNAHTLRTHMEDKHSNCNGFRCVLCGTVAKSRNSLHSHMSRQHRGISTKDLPLLPMPAPWNPEIASKYIQLVGGVGEVVRQNYRRSDKENCSNKEGGNIEAPLRSDASTPTSQENNALSPSYQKSESEKEKNNFDILPNPFNANNYTTKNPTASLFDTYLHMMRATGVDIMQGLHEKVRQDYHLSNLANSRSALDLATKGSQGLDEEIDRSLDHIKDKPFLTTDRDEKQNGRIGINANSVYSNHSDNEEEAKWNAS